MPRYEKGTAEAKAIIQQVMEEHHPKLHDAEVTVDCLMAFPNIDDKGEPTGPALKHQGYEAAAVVKINSYKLRVQGHADAEITINADKWEQFTDAERVALIDHELTHLELKDDGEGGILSDDIGRPKLGIRLHDHQFGWFNEVVERHGVASIEGKQAAGFFAGEYHPRWLPIMEAAEVE